MPTETESQLLATITQLEMRLLTVETQMASALQTLSATQTAITAIQLPCVEPRATAPVHESP